MNVRRAAKKGSANTTDATTPTAAQKGTQKLAISQRLKEVLCSKLMLSGTEADDLPTPTRLTPQLVVVVVEIIFKVLVVKITTPQEI